MRSLTRSGMSGGKSISQGSAVDLGGWMGWSEKSGKKGKVLFSVQTYRGGLEKFFLSVSYMGARGESSLGSLYLAL